ncbi:MAG: hypothetical protein ACO3ZY_12065 [Phycisphaerales bacterium]
MTASPIVPPDGRVGSDTATSDRAIAGPRMRVVTVRQACFGSAAKPIAAEFCAVAEFTAATDSSVSSASSPSGRSAAWRWLRCAACQRRRTRSVAHHGNVTAR